MVCKALSQGCVFLLMPSKRLTPLSGLWDQSCYSCVHPEGAQFWPSTRKRGSHSPSWLLQECCSTVGTLKQMARPVLQRWAGTQEGRVALKQDAGWITLHSWRGWSPKVRAAFNGVAAWEETASEGAFIMLRLWINSASCTLGSQVLLIKYVNTENKLRKRTILQLNFLYRVNRGPPPPPLSDFRQRALHPVQEFSLLPERNIWIVGDTKLEELSSLSNRIPGVGRNSLMWPIANLYSSSIT